MKNNWPVKRLGEVANVFTGFAFDSSQFISSKEKGIPLVRIRDVRNAIITETNYIGNFKDTYLIDNDSILITMDGEFISTKWKGGRALLNQRVATLNNFNGVLEDWIFYLLNDELKKIEDKTYQTTVKHISPKQIININVPLPLLGIQKKIVERLDAVRKAQELCDQQIQKTEELFESIIRKEVVDKSSKWQNKKIRELATMVGSGSTPRGGSSVYKSSGTYFIRSQNVLMLDLDFSDIVYIDERENERMKRTKVSPDDILLNITGASIGRVAIFPDQYKTANVNQHVCIIRLNNEMLPEFVLIYLSSKLGQEQIWKMQAGGTRQGLNFEQVKDLKISSPSIKEQERIVEKLEAVQNYKKLLQKEKALLKELFDSVLDKSMKGELDN